MVTWFEIMIWICSTAYDVGQNTDGGTIFDPEQAYSENNLCCSQFLIL